MQIKLYSRIPFVALLVASLAHCSSDSGADPIGPDPAPSNVAITTSATPPPRFLPANTDLAVGGTVTWTNGSPADHNLIATTSNWQLNEALPQAASFQTTVAQAGTYGYQCTLHPGMTGSIEVR